LKTVECAVHGRPGQTEFHRLEKAVEIDPHSAWAAAQLAVVYLDFGMREEAMIQADKAAELSGGGPFVGIVYAALGRREDALRILERYKETRAGRYTDAGPIAVIYDALGEVDSALVWYGTTIEERSPDVALFLSAYPEPWRTTVSDPRYETLIAPVAFPNRP
jgi:tetratricopeptide (TPR) repeat protein